MRTVEFKMERENLVQIGDIITITEREGISSYSYIIEPAVAMSGCYQSKDRIHSESGIIKDIKKTDRGFYVIVEFDE